MKAMITHLFLGLTLWMAQTTAVGADTPLTVFAAASTINVLTELGQTFETEFNTPIRFSFASSGTLARQIQSGAPADVFISANEKWMDYLITNGSIYSNSLAYIAGNQLVLIAPAAQSFDIILDGTTSLADTLKGHLAVGTMDSVPAGIYAKQALSYFNWLDPLQAQLVMGDSVRRVLTFVEQEEAEAGIVYASDATQSDQVSICGIFPPDSHKPIRYPAAIATACDQLKTAHQFIRFLKAPKSQALFIYYGFEQAYFEKAVADTP